MKKISICACIILLFNLLIFAQSEPTEPKWQRAELLQEAFSVEFPAYHNNYSEYDKNGELISGLYTSTFGKNYFFVLSEREKSINRIRAILNFLNANQADKQTKPFANFWGSIYNFRDNENFYHNVLEVKAKGKIYIFHAVSETEDDKTVKYFFDSIKWNDEYNALNQPQFQMEKPKEIQTPVETTQKTSAPVKTNQNPVQSSGRGSGSGSGIGNGSGSTTPQINVPSSAVQTTPLKILSKPRPNYTDMARIYNISGVVRVRITFLASGQIGSVTPVSKLPFGLTNSAIQAARLLSFEPARKGDQPYSVTKIVEYNFVLY